MASIPPTPASASPSTHGTPNALTSTSDSPLMYGLAGSARMSRVLPTSRLVTRPEATARSTSRWTDAYGMPVLSASSTRLCSVDGSPSMSASSSACCCDRKIGRSEGVGLLSTNWMIPLSSCDVECSPER